MDLESIRRELEKLALKTDNQQIKKEISDLEAKIRLMPGYCPF
jgi:hypothetical protein